MNDVEGWAGIVDNDGHRFLIRADLGELILDHDAYEPDEQRDPAFRGGLWSVGDGDGARFVSALRGRPLSDEELRAKINTTDFDPELIAYIDFDRRRFVHSYYDLPLEDYVPRGWKGMLGDPLDAAQESVRP